MADSSNPANHDVPERIEQRYRVKSALGRGGMARVYHVADEVSGRELALKQCLPPAGSKRDAVVALFESEFHTLAQLSHPRVIEVYDYGLTEAGPFYTMELLDGGDLYDRSPLPWRQACALLYDVCSSLALLHSRRLVHRDISPRNIRCTRDDRAKLIDFGTMVPMGHGRMVAGIAGVRRARGRVPLRGGRPRRSVFARSTLYLRPDPARSVSGARLRRPSGAVEDTAAGALELRPADSGRARRAGAEPAEPRSCAAPAHGL